MSVNTVQCLYGDPSVQFVVIPLKVFNGTNEMLYCDFNEALYGSLDKSLNSVSLESRFQ